jgi:hypothetical protein
MAADSITLRCTDSAYSNVLDERADEAWARWHLVLAPGGCGVY